MSRVDDQYAKLVRAGAQPLIAKGFDADDGSGVSPREIAQDVLGGVYVRSLLATIDALESALNRHEDWCGFSADAPGHSAYNRARDALSGWDRLWTDGPADESGADDGGSVTSQGDQAGSA